MNKRRAARELALITFSQLSKSIETIENIEIADIVNMSVSTLKKEAENDLNASVREIGEIKKFIQNYEIEHPDNLESPVDRAIIPVNIPMTSDMLGRIDTILESADKIYSALDILEISSFEEKEEVKEYIIKLVSTFVNNKKQVDREIKEHSKGWDVNRLVRVDRDILRMALTEMLYFEDVPAGVSIDEAVELAKKYSTEESSSFINGILGQIAQAGNLK